MAPPSKALATKERDQDRRKTILRAAVEVFARKGYHGCRIADVAREANVAYGLVYHYFRNKEELLQLVFETGWGGFVVRIREAAEGPATLEAKVKRIFQVAFDGYRADPRGVRVLVLEFARGPGTGEANRRGAFAEICGRSSTPPCARRSSSVRWRWGSPRWCWDSSTAATRRSWRAPSRSSRTPSCTARWPGRPHGSRTGPVLA